jgi:pimeloyl-ACP methyl ester carboxylesterase
VLQGTEDEALDGPGQGRAIAAALGARAQYVELPGMGHNALLESDAAIARLRAFIETASGQVEARH